MKKWTRILAVVVASLVVLVVALVVLANVLITPERVKETLLPLAEQNLNRKIELGEIEVSLFSGIEIQGLTLYEQDGQGIFVSTDLVRLQYQLLPLLTMNVVIDEVRLAKPTIKVVRFRDGQFNFSDLLGDSEHNNGRSEDSKPQQPSAQQTGSPISMLVSQLLLQDGQLTFFDHVLNDQAPYRYEMSGLQVAAKGVSLTGKVPLSMQCQLNGSQLALDGHVSLQPLGGDFTVDLQNLDVVAFNHYLQEFIPGTLGGLKVSLTSKVAGTLDDLALQGTLSFAELDLLLDALPESPLQDARLNVDFDLQLNQGQERLQVRHLGLDYNGIKLNTKGDLSGLTSEPALELMVDLPMLQIRQVIDAAPVGLVGDVRSLDPAGAIAIEASLSGPAADVVGSLKSTTVVLDNVQATAGGQRPAFSGRLLLKGDQLSSEDLQVRLGDNSADIDLVASRIFATPVVVNADISSERFLLEPLLQGSAGTAVATDAKQEQPKQKQANQNTVSEEIGPFDIPLHATGSIQIAEAMWQDLTIENFLASYELKDNILELKRIDGQVAGGSFSHNARVDLSKKGLAYSANLGMSSIQADPLITAFAPKAAGSLLGATDFTFALSGRGTEQKRLLRNLSGAGDLLVTDGRLISPALVNGLRSVLNLSELQDIVFDNFKGQFKVVDGKVQLDSQMLSSRLKLFPKGTIGLDGSLKLGLDTRLSPELSAKLDQRGNVSRYLADQDGWTRMPLLLKGSFSSPSFGLDPKGAQEQATKALSNELGRQINKLFNKESSQEKTQQPEDESMPAEDPAQKLLQDSLKSLFGN